MKNKLKDFLTVHKSDKGGPYTHTLIGGAGYPPGSFDIPMTSREQLYQLVEETVFNDKIPVCLTEKPSEKSPLRVDLDFKFENIDSEDLGHKYLPEDITTIVSVYNKVLNQYLNIDEGHLICYVMERKQAYVDPKNPKIIKDGIHLFYPNIILSKNSYLILRKIILAKLKAKLSRLLELTKMNIEDIVDKAVAENNWLVYGCSKPGIAPYLVTEILNYENESLLNTIPIEPSDLIVTLRVNLDSDELETSVREEYVELFSLVENNTLKRNNLTKLPDVQNNMQTGLSIVNNELILDDRYANRETGRDACSTIEEAKKLTLLLSKKRADDYFTWIRVGWCLKNISTGLLNSWIDFSRKSDKFEEGVCEREWWKTNDLIEGFNIGSLYYWAQEDNPEGFKEFNNNRIDSYVKKAASCSDQDVANLVYKIYKDEYVSTDGGAKKTDKIWYRFSNHRWSECDGKVMLRTVMSRDIPDYCRLAKIKVIEQRRKAESEEDKNYLEKIEEDIQKLINKLKNSTFKNKVVEECTYMFYDPLFFTKLDENIELIGCENGVYNLAIGEFRKGLPSDYISMSTGVKYVEEDEDGKFGPDHRKIKAINNFYAQIQPNPSVCEYLKTLNGYCLYGRNILEILPIAEGGGGNGKSKLIELNESALGAYASSIQSNYFTQKRTNSTQANPDVAKIAHARLVTTQEMDEGERFNLATFKLIVGGDKITYRPLYGSCREVRPKFNIIMAVNHLPALPADDAGTWRRIKLIKFVSRFVDNPDPNSEFEHQKDPLLSQKIQTWKEAYLYLLFQWHKRFRENGCMIKEPIEVQEATRAYQKRNDQYSEFIERFITKRTGGFLSLDRLFERLKEWWEQNASGSRPEKKLFREILEKRWNTPCQLSREFGYGWTGREICDGLNIIKTTDKAGDEVSYFGIE